MPDGDSSAPRPNRVRVFVDFWNYTLSMRDFDRDFRTDWSSLGRVLANAAGQRVAAHSPVQYQGLNFYGSYDPNSDRDRSLHRWATTVVDRFPGVSVSIVPRQRKRSPPQCPACQAPVPLCPACGADMRGTEEKGVDVRIATDMIKLAWVDNYDTAVLLSSDKDFIPLVEFLETRASRSCTRPSRRRAPTSAGLVGTPSTFRDCAPSSSANAKIASIRTRESARSRDPELPPSNTPSQGLNARDVGPQCRTSGAQRKFAAKLVGREMEPIRKYFRDQGRASQIGPRDGVGPQERPPPTGKSTRSRSYPVR